MKASIDEIAEHVASINAIPDDLITHEDRAAVLERAEAGLDVYAYHKGPGKGIWNIWDTDTRIACAPVAASWRITEVRQFAPQEWAIFVERDGESLVVQITIHLHPTYDCEGDALRYVQRAERMIRMAVQHMNLFHEDIHKLNGCQF